MDVLIHAFPNSIIDENQMHPYDIIQTIEYSTYSKNRTNCIIKKTRILNISLQYKYTFLVPE